MLQALADHFEFEICYKVLHRYLYRLDCLERLFLANKHLAGQVPCLAQLIVVRVLPGKHLWRAGSLAHEVVGLPVFNSQQFLNVLVVGHLSDNLASKRLLIAYR